MYLTLGSRSFVLSQAVFCQEGFLADGPDKFGSVTLQRDGGRLDARTALALIQTARALAAEYPSDVLALGAGDEPSAGEPFQDAILVIGRTDAEVVVASRLAPPQLDQALRVLEKYLVRLTRLDTP